MATLPKVLINQADSKSAGGCCASRQNLGRAIAGREQDKKTPAARHGLFRCAGPDEQAHEQPEIMPSNVDQIALMDIPSAPQPRPAQATAVQDVSEGALNQLRPLPHRLLPHR